MGQSKSVKISRYDTPVAGYTATAEHPDGWIVFFNDDGTFHMYSRRAPDGAVLGKSTVLSTEEFAELLTRGLG